MIGIDILAGFDSVWQLQHVVVNPKTIGKTIIKVTYWPIVFAGICHRNIQRELLAPIGIAMYKVSFTLATT